MLVAVTDVAGHRRDRGESSVGVVMRQEILDVAVVLVVIVEAVLAIDLNT